MKLATILIGKNPLSEIFIKEKEKACLKQKIKFQAYFFSSSISFEKLEKEIKKISQKKEITGVIIQLPLPKKFEKKKQEILDLIPQEKDIDFLSSLNLGNYYLSPIVQATARLIEKEKIKGKYVVLVGAGRLTGIPLSLWFLNQGSHISVLNEYTPNLSQFTKKADILVSATGKPNLIKKEMIKKGAVVIDIGNCLVKGKIRGDIEFTKKAKVFVPAVGGIGPLTIKYLLKNLKNAS